MKIKIPLVPYVCEESTKVELYAWVIARCFVAECDTGGKVNKNKYVAWLRRHGWKTPERLWAPLIHSGLCDGPGAGNTNAYLVSLPRTIQYLQGLSVQPLEHTDATYRISVLVCEYEIPDGYTIPQFKKLLTILFATRPQYRSPVSSGRRGDIVTQPPPPGRSYERIAQEARVSRRTAIRHLKDIPKVRQKEVQQIYQNHTTKLSKQYRISPGRIEAQIQNTFVASEGGWRNFLFIKMGDRLLFRRSRRMKIKCFPSVWSSLSPGWYEEDGRSNKRILPVSMAMEYKITKLLSDQGERS